MQTIHYKDDNDKYYFVMDFTEYNGISLTDSISGSPIITSEVRGGFTSDLVIGDTSVSGLYVGMWISGGTPYQTYKVSVQAVTQQGYQIEGDGFLKIGD